MEQDIVNLLDNQDRPALSSIEINDLLGYTSIDEYKELNKKLDEMVLDGTLYYSERKKRYLLLKNSHLIKGTFLTTGHEYAFVNIGDDRKDIYIGKNNINDAHNRDIVLIELIGDKTEGRVIKILKRNEESFVGTIYFKDDRCYVHPDKKNNVDMEIINYANMGLVDGLKVLVRPINGNKYVGEVIEVIGHKNDVGVDILSFVYDNNFKPKFPDEVLDYIKDLPEDISSEDISDRLDLRDKVIFTIDGDDTKDIDDAISIKRLDDGYELGVHIADVSHYVERDSVLDKEAYERGTSVYLVDRVIPMLPHRLSNGICSLNPNVDRLAMSCIMKINSHGKVTSYEIKKSVIRSRIQMTYNKVNDILDNNIIDDNYKDYVDDLLLMKELSDVLRTKMIKRGYIEFESPEPKIIVDEECNPLEIKLRSEGTGENMIENFMVVANETVGSHIFYQDLPGIYRVHDKPDTKKLDMFFKYLAVRGYVVNGRKKDITAHDLQDILKQLEDKPDTKVLNDLAIRCQAKAIYSSTNIGHFGLGSKCYSHFTSPIRRYPDLILHRLIKDYSDNYNNEVIEFWSKHLEEMAVHCSTKEQDSIKCERDVDSMKMAQYMEGHIGEEFEGVISGVHEFGMFVELSNTIEGLVKIEDMPSGGYRYVEDIMALVNKSNKKKYVFGDSVIVRCIAASRETSMIDFELVERK